MIKLAFTISRKIIKYQIENRVVTYFDDNWKEGIQVMPVNDSNRLMVRKMLIGRRSTLRAAALFIVDANSGKNKEEFEACKTDEDIAEIIRKENKSKGLIEIK